MKLKVYIKRLDKSNPLPHFIEKGDWVDLYNTTPIHITNPVASSRKRKMTHGVVVSSRDVHFTNVKIPLGVAMKLPSGCEAILVSRSGTYDNYHIVMTNGIGIIDETYQGNNDEWKYNVICFGDSFIDKGKRVCQFRVQLSQKATFWQKLKWMLSSGIEFVEVDNLTEVDRGGFGTTN